MPKIETIIIQNFADITYTAYPNKNNPNHYFIEAIKFWSLKSQKAKKIGEEYLKKTPQTLLDVHIRLYLLSTLAYKPTEINMDGILDILPDLFWVSGRESYTYEQFYKKFSKGDWPNITPDKFPKIQQMVKLPKNIRIEDPNSVRYGAYLAPGTVVKSPGLINANAGTLGPCMIEGRIPFGTTIKFNTHVGAGAGIIGILSNESRRSPIQIGGSCLLGANSECGISLGDNCTIEAGLALMPGMKVRFYKNGFLNKFDSTYEEVNVLSLSKLNNITFVRHSLYGYVAAIQNFK